MKSFPQYNRARIASLLGVLIGLSSALYAVNPDSGGSACDGPGGCDPEGGSSGPTGGASNHSVDISLNIGGVAMNRTGNYSTFYLAAGANQDDEERRQTLDAVTSYYDQASLSNRWRGELRLKTETITADSFKISSLEYNHTQKIQILRQNGEIRQVLSKDFLVDLQELPAGQEGFEAKWYFLANKGQWTSGIYTPVGNPVKTATISNPTPLTNYNTLDFHTTQEMPDGTRVVHYRFVFQNNTAGNMEHRLETWTKTPTDVGAEKIEEDILEYFSGAPLNGQEQLAQERIRTLRRADLNTDGSFGALTTISRTWEKYQDIGGKKRMTEEIRLDSLNSNTTGLKTTIGYYNQPGNTLIHGRKRWQKNPDGSWTVWNISGTQSNLTIKEITPFENGAYVLASDGSNVDSVVENEARVETKILTGKTMETFIDVLGQRVSRMVESFATGSSGERVNIRKRYTGVGAEHFVSTQAFNPYGNGQLVSAGRLAWKLNEDGTATTYDYVELPNEGSDYVQVTMREGGITAWGSELDAPTVNAGLETITKFNEQMQPYSMVRKDIESGEQLDSWVAMPGTGYTGQIVDLYGRWSCRVFNFNPDDFESRLFDCCGLKDSRSRTGATVSRSIDLLRRPYKLVSRRSSVGEAVTREMSEIGLIKTETVTAGTISSFVSSKVERNLLGQVVNRWSPDEQGSGNPLLTSISTLYDEVNGGVTVISIVDPNGIAATSIRETYRDGQLKAISGNAVADRFFDYDVHNEGGGGIRLRSIAGSIVTGSEWLEAYRDALGRRFKTAYPDGSYSEKSFFAPTAALGSRGKLSSEKDADEIANAGTGTLTSYIYNSGGEVETTTEVMPPAEAGGAQSREAVTLRDVVNTVDVVVNGQTTTITPAFRTVQKVNTIIVSTVYRSVDGYTTATVGLNGSSVSKQEIPSDGGWTFTSWTPDGQSSKQTFADGLLEKNELFDKADGFVTSTSYSYDALGRTVTTTDSRTGGVGSTIYSGVPSTGYSDAGNLLGMQDAGGRLTSYVYDAMGRRIKVDSPNTDFDNVSETSYYATSRIKAQWGDGVYPRFFEYDEQNRLVKLHTYQSIPLLAHATSSAPAGSAITTWIYDSMRGWLDEKQDDDNEGASYEYTPAGRLAKRTWARGVVTDYSYEQGLLSGVAYSNEANGFTTPDLDYHYDEFGRLETVRRGGVIHAEYEYDPTNLRLTGEMLNQDTFSQTLDRRYDGLGRPISVEVGAGEHSLGYGYDLAGRLAEVWHAPALDGNGFPLGNADFVYGFENDSFGLVKTVTGPAHTVANVWEADREVLDKKSNNLSAGSLVSEYDYSVNVLGQRTSVTQSGSAFGSQRTLSWSYDRLGQVVSADHSLVGAQDQAFEYDAIGNRKKSVHGGLTLPGGDHYVANEVNEYVTTPFGHAVSHDQDGNLLSGTVPGGSGGLGTELDETAFPAATNLVWNAENRLVSLQLGSQIVTYDYDYLGRRIKRSMDGTAFHFIYDDWNPLTLVVEKPGETKIARRYTWGTDFSGTLQGAGGVGGLLVAEIKGSDTAGVNDRYYPCYDGNGNVCQYIDSSGNVDAAFEYDSFGRTVANIGVNFRQAFRHRFSTKYRDLRTGLHYYGYRHSNPATGRWPSRDPIEEEGGVNLYGFVKNRATNGIDLLGQQYIPFNGNWLPPSKPEKPDPKDGNCAGCAFGDNGYHSDEQTEERLEGEDCKPIDCEESCDEENGWEKFTFTRWDLWVTVDTENHEDFPDEWVEDDWHLTRGEGQVPQQFGKGDRHIGPAAPEEGDKWDINDSRFGVRIVKIRSRECFCCCDPDGDGIYAE